MKNNLTDEERAMLKESLQNKMSNFVDDATLDFFWSPFESLTKTQESSIKPPERAALKKKIADSGTRQRQSLAIYAIIAFLIVIFSYPYWLIGVGIDILLLFIWAHLSTKFLKYNITSYDKFILLDTYNQRMTQWNWEYLQLRETLYEVVRSKDAVKRERILREMCRYLKQGIIVLGRPRLIDDEPLSLDIK